ncbi:cytochrome c-type biogenesis protein CcmE [Ehrlichia ruminantium]|uniref:cytochrome c maturation protein CcmE n=1 Tax=Ehrlichia ruminantium TaxID=779 RepID=UPI0007C10D63|nr:cytochrome c maturation protein CcmE [Ehrlichia ruminantium]QLK52230.1 cytochrome c maturation protein CcmE [Ehrlichia ruminantium]QLK54061.1 cytochrome c maturation protein CcmE [Ehrlichia ruminantium]QLK56812.1 cytochrome c maturation protein CcmE [Ehrlichia ruminantium]GAT76126.1 cytochrome c-type biogenesis protein CcmE [Ehrlichia ruminantium]
MKRKYRRFFVVIITLSIFAGSVVLVLGKLKNNVSFFYTPTELLSSSLINKPNIRIGGMVVKGTVQKYDDSIVFHITDLKNYIKVVYKGILPPLFSEGSWIVAKGKMVNGKFIANEILAKHDENYMPNKYKTNNL